VFNSSLCVTRSVTSPSSSLRSQQQPITLVPIRNYGSQLTTVTTVRLIYNDIQTLSVNYSFYSTPGRICLRLIQHQRRISITAPNSGLLVPQGSNMNSRRPFIILTAKEDLIFPQGKSNHTPANSLHCQPLFSRGKVDKMHIAVVAGPNPDIASTSGQLTTRRVRKVKIQRS